MILHRLLAKYFFFLATFIYLLSFSRAQSNTPSPVSHPQYFATNNILYVQGGLNQINPVSVTTAFYSLDLTKPFNDQSPPWMGLASAPFQNSDKAMTTSPDKKTVYIWDGSHITVYNTASNSWVTIGLTVAAKLEGLKALTDPNGVLFVPNGCSNGMDPNPVMCMFNVTANTWGLIAMPSSMPTTSVSYYSWVTSQLRKSMILYGGIGIFTQIASPYLFEFISATQTWTTLVATGALPGDLNTHCMVQTSDNSSMILYGGISSAKVISSSIYILDVAKLSWIKGTDAPSYQGRYGHVCATNGDSFLVWSGQNATGLMSNVPMIYNIPSNQWVHDFVLSGSSPTSASSTKSSSGGAIGGAIGGVIVILAVLGFFYRRRRLRNHGQITKPLTSSSSSDGGSLQRNLHSNGRVFNSLEVHEENGRGGIPLQDTISSPQEATTSSMACTVKPLSLVLSTDRSFNTYATASDQAGNSYGTLNIHNKELLSDSQSSSPISTRKSSPHALTSAIAGNNNTSPKDAMTNHPFVHAPQSVPAGMTDWSVGIDASPEQPRSPQKFISEAVPLVFPPSVGHPQLYRNVGTLAEDNSNNLYLRDNRWPPTSDGRAPNTYYPPSPPPPPLDSANSENTELVRERLALMKAQHELNLARIRLEQASEAQLMERLLHQE